MTERIIDSELIKRIVMDDADGFKVVKEDVGDHGRWALGVDTTFERLSDNKLFIVHWRKGATEYQEHEFHEDAVEAEAYAVTEIKYRPKA